MTDTLIPLDPIPSTVACGRCGRTLKTRRAKARGLGSHCWDRLHLVRLPAPRIVTLEQLRLDVSPALRARQRSIIAFRRARSVGRRWLMRSFA